MSYSCGGSPGTFGPHISPMLSYCGADVATTGLLDHCWGAAPNRIRRWHLTCVTPSETFYRFLVPLHILIVLIQLKLCGS